MHNKNEAELVNVIIRLEQRGAFFWVVAGLVLVIGVGIVDLFTGYELAFSLFYFLPVSLVAWLGLVWCGCFSSAPLLIPSHSLLEFSNKIHYFFDGCNSGVGLATCTPA